MTRHALIGWVPQQPLKSLIGLVAGIFALVLLPAAPASAHSDSEPIAGNYLTKLVKVTPATDGVKLRVVQNGTRLELRNDTSKTLEVLGYSGEPYLRIGPDGAYANTRSPSVYVNDDLGARQPPDNVELNATATPKWRKVDDRSAWTWHDHRTHWMSEKAPPVVAKDPERRHRISVWTITFRDVGDGHPIPTETRQPRQLIATGTLDYIPPPATGVWWAGILAAAGAVVALTLLLPRGRDPKQTTFRVGLSLAGLLGIAAVTELINSVGYALDSGATGPHIVADLFTTQTYGTLTALAALTATVVAIRNHPAALLALGLAGVCLAVLGGVTDIAVFSHGRAALPWSPEVARLCTATTLALAGGVTVACWLRIRAERTERTARRDAIESALNSRVGA